MLDQGCLDYKLVTIHSAAVESYQPLTQPLKESGLLMHFCFAIQPADATSSHDVAVHTLVQFLSQVVH